MQGGTPTALRDSVIDLSNYADFLAAYLKDQEGVPLENIGQEITYKMGVPSLVVSEEGLEKAAQELVERKAANKREVSEYGPCDMCGVKGECAYKKLSGNETYHGDVCYCKCGGNRKWVK